MQVLDPSGATEVARRHAPRLDGLAGRTVAMLSDDMWQAHRMLPRLRAALEERFPGVTVIPETEWPMGNAAIDREETAELLAARGVEAVVVGNAA